MKSPKKPPNPKIQELIKEVEVYDGPNPVVADKNGQKRRVRASKTQMQLRIQQVVTWLLEGTPYTEMMSMGMKKWGLTQRPIEYYIQQAKEQVEAHAATEIKSATTLAIFRLMTLYDQCISEGDYKTALDVIKTQNRLLGLNAPDKIETKTVENWDTMSVAEQFKTIEEKLKSKIKPDQLN